MNMSKTSVAARMNTYAIAALLSALLIAGISLSGVQELARAHDHSFGHARAALIAAEDSSLAAETYQVIADAIIQRKPEESSRNMDAIKIRAREEFVRLQAAAETGKQRQLIAEAAKAHASMVALFEQRMLPLLRQVNPDHAAIMTADADIDAQGAIVKSSLARFSQSMSQVAIAADQDFNATQGNIFMHDAVTSVAVLLLLLTTSWWITRSIIRQLGGEPHYLAEVMHRMAGGDISVDIRVAMGDRNSILVKAKEISDRFAHAIMSIHKAERSLERAASQVSAMAQVLSESTSQQASEAIQTSSSIEQVSISICRNREHANATDDMAAVTAKEVAAEKQAINDTVCSMKNIAGKVDTLHNLTSQSKMLALDTIIEAARAGKQGSRIKAMAEKMCELIDRTQLTAQEITGLSCKSVSAAGKAIQLIEKMEPNLTITADLAQEVYCSSSEQSRGVAQINSAIVHLSQATQQNASASEQLAATAEEMNELTDQLHDAMTFFKLGKVVIPAGNQARNTPEFRNGRNATAPGFYKSGFIKRAA